MPKLQYIQLKDIVNKFDVRTKLDEDRVIQFAGIYESGGDLPPVRLVKLDDEPDKYAYIDGRHRGAAREFLNLEEVPAYVVNTEQAYDPAWLYTEALKSNWGGSKPPTREDIAHTIIRMMELGVSQREIKERLDFLPKGSVDSYISWAKGVIYKRKTTAALNAIAEGATIIEAADQFKLKVQQVQDLVLGKKGKWGKRTDEQQTVNDLKNFVGKTLNTANMTLAKKLDYVMKAIEDGEMSGKAAIQVLEYWRKRNRQTEVRIKDWISRAAEKSGLSISPKDKPEEDHPESQEMTQ